MRQNDYMVTELRDHIKKNGRKGLLPQNLTSALLKKMSLEADAIGEEKTEKMPFYTLLVTILYIQNGPKMFKEIEIKINPELFTECLDLYIVAVRLEEMRRNKIIEIPDDSLPTLKNIFDPKSNMDIVVLNKC